MEKRIVAAVAEPKVVTVTETKIVTETVTETVEVPVAAGGGSLSAGIDGDTAGGCSIPNVHLFGDYATTDGVFTRLWPRAARRQ